MRKQTVCYLFPALVLLAGCSSRGGGAPTDDPTSGTIHITVDESYQPMMEAEEEMFESLYKNAHINISYTSEVKAFEDLIADSSRFIVVNRELNSEEEAYFKSIELTPKVIHIANDGLAFIVNTNNPVRKLLYGQVGDLFSGKLSAWNQLNSTMAADSIQVIFDHAGSGNVRMIKEKFDLKDKLPSNCFAVNSNPEVVDYVEKHPEAIGIISVNWISDAADSNTIDFMKKIKVLEIGNDGNTDTAGTFYGPYQGYIANESYPFIRKTYIISREARAGLGTGFASFISGDKGQRIILRSGMVPAVAPVRIVNITN